MLQLFKAVLYASVLTWLATHFGNAGFSNDSAQYLTYAKNWVSSGTFGLELNQPDMHREPTYGIFLGEIYRLFLNLNPLRAEQSEVLLTGFIFFQSLVLYFSVQYFTSAPTFVPLKRKILMLLGLFSPSIMGAASVIYSEAIAIPALFFTLGSLFRLQAAHSVKSNLLRSTTLGLSLGIFLLTKSIYHFYFYALCGAVAFLPFYTRISEEFRHFLKKLRPALVLSLTILIFWNIRNQVQLGENATTPRMASAIAGKVLRVQQWSLPEDLPKALIAAIGTNLCYRTYSPTECQNFEIIGASYFNIWGEYQKTYLTNKATEKAIMHDMLKQYFKNPGLQLLGSAFELIRISFFEASEFISTDNKFFGWFPKFWHFVGSLFGQILFIFGLSLYLKAPQKSPVELLALSLLGFHILVSIQTTNLIRYSLPMLPIIYLFASRSIEIILQKALKKGHQLQRLP